MSRILVAIAAMIVLLATGYLIVNSQTNASGIRIVISVVLIFGIAFLGAALALAFQSKESDK